LPTDAPRNPPPKAPKVLRLDIFFLKFGSICPRGKK
jgi:hypothetical protein